VKILLSPIVCGEMCLGQGSDTASTRGDLGLGSSQGLRGTPRVNRELVRARDQMMGWESSRELATSAPILWWSCRGGGWERWRIRAWTTLELDMSARYRICKRNTK